MAIDFLIATHNLRLDLAVDGIHRFWERFVHLPGYWSQLGCDVFAFQEVTPPMMERMREAMLDYELIGDYRSPGAEACPIAYRKAAFRLIETRTIWLTDTPLLLSKDPESKYPRIATIAILQALDQSMVQIVNVHLDYASESVAMRQIAAAVNHVDPTIPFVVLGDFNGMKETSSCLFLERIGLENLVRRFALRGATFHGFSECLEGEPIDHLFVSQQVHAISARIDRSRPSQGYYSDHDPIVARLIITS
jgi:endonuclease/exonuclease/phosphatase family metal-dependent hydrolase